VTLKADIDSVFAGLESKNSGCNGVFALPQADAIVSTTRLAFACNIDRLIVAFLSADSASTRRR
jgi:hypothetical protein